MHRNYPGMAFIPSAGQSFTMGSSASIAKMDEKPEMSVCFSYNYWLDSCEVTQSLYDSIMGKISGTGSQMNLSDKKLPVQNLTWYDALLFCNARSKVEGLDSVYSYSSKDTAGVRTTGLNALSIHLDKLGFRLPTEAEWEYAAKAGTTSIFPWGGLQDTLSAEDNAWFNKNAGNQLHPVCALKKSHWGLYDMEGNAMEWTDDIKGPYYQGTIVDPIGNCPPTGDDYIPVKGGSFCHDIAYLRPSCRTDIYPVTASTATSYIGFRCALGVIKSGHYLSNPRSTVNGLFPVSIATIGSAVTTLRLAKAKIAFVNNCNDAHFLCTIDFGENVPKVSQFNDMNNVCFSDISPDGNWVAFSTQGPGRFDTSSILIRGISSTVTDSIFRLSGNQCFAPRWWVDTIAQDTFICYTDATGSNSDPRWATTSTFLQKMTGGRPSGTPQVIVSRQGSYYGGISRNGDFLATGYPRLLMINRATNEVRRLFIGPWNGKSSGDSSQVCNVSISPSRVNQSRALFLDFGSSQISTVTGRSYGVHEYCFIADFSQQVVKWFQSPSGEFWDYPRWSNSEEWAIAAGQLENGQHPRLYLMNLVDSACLKIVEGVDLLYPCLWFPNEKTYQSGDLSLDSAGYYNTPASTNYQSQLSEKLPLFWKMCDSLEVLFLGSSEMVSGINPLLIKNFFSLNIGYAGCDILGQTILINNYAVPHCPKLRAVVISLDPAWLAKPGGDFSWNAGTANTLGFNYDKSHDFWRTGVPDGFSDLVQNAPHPDLTYEYSTRGFWSSPIGNWGTNPPPLYGQADTSWNITDICYQNNIAMLWATAKVLSDRNIHFIIINFPMSPAYASQTYYGPWGPSSATGNAITDGLELATEGNKFVHFYDAHKKGLHDYLSDDASDEDHLSWEGAEKLTGRVDSLLNQYLQK